jgi:hypothetical protein
MDEVAVLPAAHPLAQQPLLAARDFEGQPFISLARDDPYRQQIDAVFARPACSAGCGDPSWGWCSTWPIVNPLVAACAGPQLVVRPLAFSQQGWAWPWCMCRAAAGGAPAGLRHSLPGHVLLLLHRPAEPADALVAALQHGTGAAAIRRLNASGGGALEGQHLGAKALQHLAALVLGLAQHAEHGAVGFGLGGDDLHDLGFHMQPVAGPCGLGPGQLFHAAADHAVRQRNARSPGAC